jgi:hypothetical protein
VECFHRTLKAAIMCHADQHGTEVLPLVILRILTAFKADLQVSVAELVYGEPLAPKNPCLRTDSYSRTHQTGSCSTPRLPGYIRTK